MKTLSCAFIGLAALAMRTAATAADTISFGDYFFPGDILGNGFASVTDGFVPFTVSGPGSDFEVEIEGGAWMGEFVRNTTVIYDKGSPGPVTIVFGSPIDGIGDLAIQPAAPGPYTATLTAYDGATVVGGQTVQGFNAPGAEGSIAYFFVAAPEITSLVLMSTNDSEGVAVGGGIGIPEPSGWALMLTGSALAGGGLRLRRRRSV